MIKTNLKVESAKNPSEIQNNITPNNNIQTIPSNLKGEVSANMNKMISDSSSHYIKKEEGMNPSFDNDTEMKELENDLFTNQS